MPNATPNFTAAPQGTSAVGLVAVDFSGDTGEFRGGGYILRVGKPDDRLRQRNELAASELLRGADRGFAEAHIPKLLRIHEVGDDETRQVVTLYQLAGGSLSRYVAPRTRSTGLRLSARRIARDVLTAWSDPQDMRRMTPHELLTDLVGEDRVEDCLQAAESFFSDGALVEEAGYAFLDPRQVLGPERDDAVLVMYGCCHGDLHNRNLLVPRDERADDEDYWIVDLDRAHPGAAGFDLAYLEVSVLVNIMSDLRSSVLSRCLSNVEDVVNRPVPDDTDWLMGFLRHSREGIQEWIAEQPGRLDQLDLQFMLVRMIAGLLWASRFEPDSAQARICLAYAGWYAMRYRRAVAAAAELVESPHIAGKTDTDEEAKQQRVEAEGAQWESLWEAVNGFAPAVGHYVLVAERMPAVPSVAALGRLPWSLIVDLDPRSDYDGLYHRAGPVLESQRAVHLFTRKQPTVDYARSTAWTLAVGSVRLNEPPDDLRTWGHKRLTPLRQLLSSFRQAVGDIPLHVVVLADNGHGGSGAERDRLLRVIDAVDEALQGRETIHYVGPTAPTIAVPLTAFDLPLSALLDRLSETLGTTPDVVDYMLPAADRGTAAMSPETMQKLREHLVVLHDGIELSVQPAQSHHNDEFWRGGLISWADLDSGRDVPRTITQSLVTMLRDSLEQHRTRTVLLQHKPGTGGTTVALRAAWDLHHEYPVAVLPHGGAVDRARVPLIADRLNLLYSTTQAPVLLVAESGDLSESDREALYQELGKRGTHVTVLYVRRGVSTAGSNALGVDENLDPVETADFERRYSALIDEPARISELRHLSRGADERYRTPFFYGLITFERKFTKLSDYVNSHLERVRGRAADVMKYLALVTIYSNNGLQWDQVHKLMRYSSHSAGLELADVLGPGAARLVVVRSGRVRLQHQLIAEQVLAHLFGDEQWEYYLKDLAIDFIEALTHATDVSSDPVRVLLQQMFVIRQGGTVDGVDDGERGHFSPLIERLSVDPAHEVLRSLTHYVPDEPHFWNHLGRHQMYRLSRELDKAEQYVSYAVDLAEDDFIHHHTLGLTRRAILKQELKKRKSRGVTAVMKVIEEHFERTVGCFEESRALNRENLHAYITHVQTIIIAAQALKAAARVRSVADLDSLAGDWVADQVGQANELLHEAARVYGTLDDQDSYVVSCRAGINQLYNDLDAVVEAWEIAVTGRRTNPMVQRALAQAYHARGGRRWRNLSEPELRRIVEMARQNMSRHDCREEDYRLWFEAYKELPEFDIDEALATLQLWTERFPTWRGHYYRCCLLFHLWFSGLSHDTTAFRDAQRASKELVPGRPKQSFLWLARRPRWYPVISDGDLGEWDRKKGFWKNTEPLQRVNGHIDVMRNAWSGLIKLDGSVTAFFVPKTGNFLPDSDETQPVNFFLGMSPDGLQAWEVQRGHLPDAVSARTVIRRDLPPLAPVEPEREAVWVPPTVLAARAKKIRDSQKTAFLLSLMRAWQEVGHTPLLSTVTERLQARYCYDANDVFDLLDRTGQISRGDGDDPEIRLTEAMSRQIPATRVPHAPGQRASRPPGQKVLGRVIHVQETRRSGTIAGADGLLAKLSFDDIQEPSDTVPRQGQLLWMEREQDRRGHGVAREVELLPLDATLVEGELVLANQLWERVGSDLRDQMDSWTNQDKGAIHELEVTDWLEDRFAGTLPLAERLGIGELSRLWGELEWLRCTNAGDGHVLSLETRAVFGRVGSDRRAEEPVRSRPAASPTTFGEALAVVVDELREASGSDPTFSAVRKRLSSLLGRRFSQVVGPQGGRSLEERILAEPGWEVSNKPGEPGRVRRRPGSTPLREAVRDLQAAGIDPCLPELGKALRKQLGANYAATIGASLKRWVNSQPDWVVREERPGHEVVRPRGREQQTVEQTGDMRSAPRATQPAGPNVAADLAEIIDALLGEGKQVDLNTVGGSLSARWGPKTYRKVTGRRRLRLLIQDHGWEVYEVSSGTQYVRKAGADTRATGDEQ